MFVIPSPRELLEELAAAWGQDELDEILRQWQPAGRPTESPTSAAPAAGETGTPSSEPAAHAREFPSAQSGAKPASTEGDPGDPGDTLVSTSPGKSPAARSTGEEEAGGNTPDAREPAADAKGEPIALGDRSLVIGRSPNCDLRYRSRTLSRRHARIYPEQGAYLIEDLGSINGVEVDAQRIRAPYELRPGQVVTLGIYEFEFDGEHLIPLREELSDEELRKEGRR